MPVEGVVLAQERPDPRLGDDDWVDGLPRRERHLVEHREVPRIHDEEREPAVLQEVGDAPYLSAIAGVSSATAAGARVTVPETDGRPCWVPSACASASSDTAWISRRFVPSRPPKMIWFLSASADRVLGARARLHEDLAEPGSRHAGIILRARLGAALTRGRSAASGAGELRGIEEPRAPRRA